MTTIQWIVMKNKLHWQGLNLQPKQPQGSNIYNNLKTKKYKHLISQNKLHKSNTADIKRIIK